MSKDPMTKQKIGVLSVFVIGFLFLSFGIAQILVNDIPVSGRWKTQAFYLTLKHFFGSYAVYVNALIWLVFGGLLMGSSIKTLRASPTNSANQESDKKTVVLGRLRNRTSRKKRKQDGV